MDDVVTSPCYTLFSSSYFTLFLFFSFFDSGLNDSTFHQSHAD